MISLCLFLTGIPQVQGASVTCGNSVIIANAFGRLTCLGNLQADMFAVYTNGTIFWDVRTSNTIQLVYTYTAQSYGNGTFTVRFRGPPPATVKTGGHLATAIPGSQDIVYSGTDPDYGRTGGLTVSYRGVKFSLQDAAMVMALMTPVVIAIGLAKWSENPLDPNRAEKMRKLYYAGLIMSLGTATLFILSQLFT